MKISEKDFIQAHIKQASAKTLAELVKVSPEPTEEEQPKNAYLSPTGGEIHVNGPTVQYLNKGESLAEKIARFDRLSEQVAQNRRLMAGLVEDMMSEEEDPDDFDFIDGEDVDEFGDIIEKAPVKGVQPLPAEPAQPVKEQVEPAPVAEPTATPEGDAE